MELTLVGKIGKPHGLKGEVKCMVEEAYAADILQAKVLFLEQQGQQLPYFVSNIRTGNATILELEEVTNKETASYLRNSPIFMRSEDLLSINNRVFNKLTYGAYEGYTLTDKEIGEIGVIVKILEMPQQEMALIEYQEKEILIPMNEAFIVEIAENEKLIRVELPEGLLELF